MHVVLTTSSSSGGGKCASLRLLFFPVVRSVVNRFFSDVSVGDTGDSSVPLSPNRVQAGHSQDVSGGGLSVSWVASFTGFFFRPSRDAQQFLPDGVLLPTTLDDFSDSVLGDPITYAQCEQLPGSDTPMPLPVYSLPSGLTHSPDQSSVQTVLASGTSSHPEVGSSAVAPPMDMEDSPLLETGLPGCPYRFTSYRGQPFADGNPALACSFITRGFWSLSLCRSRLAYCAVHQRSGGSAWRGTGDGIMLSNLQILSQFATSLHHMSSEMMVLGIGQMVFPQAEVADLSPAPRAARVAKYMSRHGHVAPSDGSG